MSAAAPATQRRGTLAPLLALTVAGAAQAVDVSLHNTAIATAAIDLGMDPSQRAFAASVGTLAMAASILAVGNLGDRIGRRRVLLWSCIALVLGGILTAIAPNTAIYCLGRILTGPGLAGTLCLSMALIRTVTPQRVAASMSFFFAGQVLLALPLSVLGGWVLGFGWRWGYLMVPIVAVIAFALNLLFSPEAKSGAVGKFDLLGVTLVAIALSGIIWGVSQASAGWTSTAVLVPLGIGVVAFIAFLWWESRIESPALPVRLFAKPDLAGALTADLSFNMWQAVMLLQLSMLWQYVYLYDPLQVTLGQLPATLAMAVGAFAAGRFIARGSRPEFLVIAGLFGLVAATAVLATGGASTPYWVFAIAIVIGGFSRMLTETSAGGFFVSIPPPDLVGSTVASKPAIGQSGFALGSALSSTFLFAGIGSRTQEAFDQAGLTAAQQAGVIGYFSGDDHAADTVSAELLATLQGVAEQIYVEAYRTTMIGFTVVFLVLAVITSYFLWWKQRKQWSEEETPAPTMP